MQEKIPYEERKEISRLMRNRHGVFYKFWELVTPYWDDKVPTACVGIDATNKNLSFAINKKFWTELTDEQKQFVVSHEAYHLINQHGRRANGKFDEAKNVTLDLPINEGLVKYFGFDRAKLDFEQFCWVDKIFPDGDAEMGRSFEYYYDKLKKDGRIVPKPSGCNDHSGMPNGKQEGEFLDKLIESLDSHEAEQLKNLLNRQELGEKKDEQEGKDPSGSQAGTGTAGMIAKIDKIFTPKKKKWEQVIKKFCRRKIEKEFEVNHWVMKDRRMAMFNPDFMLPHDVSLDDRQNEKKKQSIFCFLDVSGSCWGFKERFYKAFDSIPKNIKVRLFSFDDVAYELDAKERRVIGGGGTTFTCIENKIQEVIKRDNLMYPGTVVVLTDGMANKVKPEKPQNWLFLLTCDYFDCIPAKSKRFDLRDFE